ncbi:Uncharacterised protein [[Clostridium] sordellii]|uniref:hypothetical protein n=1 Tax=Paraclostridium sordellii TaxID=1505 RepID=UPI0005E32676|nr:hypothetical protein [Paeniclostridium sordellii]CEO36541.1 Uncharacterised protein [[Clostridium] sordellii] [Paeniclostridium sordellii]
MKSSKSLNQENQENQENNENDKKKFNFNIEYKNLGLGLIIGIIIGVLIVGILTYLKPDLSKLNSMATLVIGIIFGFIVGVTIKNINYLKKIRINIADLVIFASFIVAIWFMWGGINNKLEEPMFAAVSNFYVSFIFAWLLTKKSSKESYEHDIEKTALMSYKQLHNLEGNVNFALRRTKEMSSFNTTLEKCSECSEQEVFRQKICRVQDNLVGIIQSIDSSKSNWATYISDESRLNKIKSEDCAYDQDIQEEKGSNPTKDASDFFNSEQQSENHDKEG